jgi:hypothetical protein
VKDRVLKQLQRDFYQDVLASESVSENYLNNGNFTPQDLIQIYRNQYFLSLSESLAKSYSCVKRLVGEDFFNKIAKDFIITHPSKTGNIIDYGDVQTNIAHLKIKKATPNPNYQALSALNEKIHLQHISVKKV